MSLFLDISIRYEYVYLIVFMYCIQINHIDKIALEMIIHIGVDGCQWMFQKLCPVCTDATLRVYSLLQ